MSNPSPPFFFGDLYTKCHCCLLCLFLKYEAERIYYSISNSKFRIFPCAHDLRLIASCFFLQYLIPRYLLTEQANLHTYCVIKHHMVGDQSTSWIFCVTIVLHLSRQVSVPLLHGYDFSITATLCFIIVSNSSSVYRGLAWNFNQRMPPSQLWRSVVSGGTMISLDQELVPRVIIDQWSQKSAQCIPSCSPSSVAYSKVYHLLL